MTWVWRSLLVVIIATPFGVRKTGFPGLIRDSSGAEKAQMEVRRNVQVSKAEAGIAHREVVIAVDPNHAGRLIACSMLRGERHTVHSVAYVSFDGGKTWKLGAIAPEQFADDPTCAYGPDGTVYFIAKTETLYPRHSSSDSDALFIHRSRDGGKTWDRVIHGILANDRPFMVVDNTEGPNRGHIYVAFNEHLHGENAAQRPGDTGHPHTPDDFRNTVRLVTYVNHADCMRYVYDRMLMDQGGVQVASPDVGATAVLSDGTVAVLVAHALHGRAYEASTGKPLEEKAWLELLLSTDGGETLEPVRKIVNVHSTYNLASSRGVTADMAVDLSGRFKNRLYVVLADVSTGRARIMFTESSDRGRHWATPHAIDDDHRRGSGGPDDFMPEVAVNKDGVVGVQWYDRRDNPDNLGYYVRFTASLDGGQTWLPSVRVSKAPNKVPPGGMRSEGFSVTGGDTAGLAADADGVFHALWVDNRTGVQQVWVASIVVRPGAGN